MLYMTVGVYRKRLSIPLALKILLTCVLFNLIGGDLRLDRCANGTFSRADRRQLYADLDHCKIRKIHYQILVEAMFANIVVNTAVLVSMRMKDDAGKSQQSFSSSSSLLS